MSPCKDRWEALLVADVDELVGTADTELTRHIAECAACRAVAAHLVEEMEFLDAAKSA